LTVDWLVSGDSLLLNGLLRSLY